MDNEVVKRGDHKRLGRAKKEVETGSMRGHKCNVREATESVTQEQNGDTCIEPTHIYSTRGLLPRGKLFFSTWGCSLIKTDAILGVFFFFFFNP